MVKFELSTITLLVQMLSKKCSKQSKHKIQIIAGVYKIPFHVSSHYNVSIKTYC